MFYLISLTHKISVSIFLIIYLVKALMLVAGKKEVLDNFRKKSKVPEMIIATLFLITGIFMLIKGGHPEPYMMVKIVLVLLSIPLAVIGLKKDKKILLVLSVVILIYVYGIAETKSLTFSRPGTMGVVVDVNDGNYQLVDHGKAIYQQHCMRCHGIEGNKMRYESPDLTKSKLDEAARWEIINNGKGMMPAFGSLLDDNESKALEAFVKTLKN